jgi:tetratricopeptide (TPR) repeat protein
MDAQAAVSLLELAESTRAGISGPDSETELRRLEEYYTDLTAALRWFVDAARPDEGRRLANALYPYWITKQRFDDGAASYDLVLRAAVGDERLHGAACINAGFMPFWQGDDDRAAELFEQGLEIGRRLGDPGLTSQALAALARVALRSDLAEARRLASEALAAGDEGGDRRARSNAMHVLGVGAQMAGDLGEARTWMRQRLALVREDQNEFLISSEASNLSMVERQLGNLDEAEVLAREALVIAERRGDEFTKPFALSGIAAIATDRGEFERAATLVGAAEAIMERQGAAWPPDERPHYERMLTVLPGAMGRDLFDRTRAAGRVMSTADAVAYALGTDRAR